MPALPPSSDFTGAATQAAAQTAYGNQRSFLAGLLGTAGDQATALATLGALANSVQQKSAAYTVATSDRGTIINATSGPWTLSLLAAATAGNGFAFIVRNSSAAAITVDPNASEQVNGQTTQVIPPRSSMLLACNGSSWTGFDMPGPAQVSATDSAVGATLRIATDGGAFGLGNTGNLPTLANFDATNTPAGIYAFGNSTSTTGTRPADWSTSVTGTIMVFYDNGNLSQLAWRSNPASGASGIYKRSYVASAWTTWDTVFLRSNLLGTVSQTAGVPTGAAIERGSNANGEYVKFADGTLICTIGNLTVPDSSTAVGNLFRSSADVTWTFPATFAASPIVTGEVISNDCWLSPTGAPLTTSADMRAMSAVSKASTLTVRAQAIGRWF